MAILKVYKGFNIFIYLFKNQLNHILAVCAMTKLTYAFLNQNDVLENISLNPEIMRVLGIQDEKRTPILKKDTSAGKAVRGGESSDEIKRQKDVIRKRLDKVLKIIEEISSLRTFEFEDENEKLKNTRKMHST